MFEFDVFTAHHDDIKGGGYKEIRSRVLISEEFPSHEAFALAGCMAVAIHGGMPTRILPRI